MSNVSEESILMMIYQKAQDSAEHYGNMTWTLITFLLAASITIFYLYLTLEQRSKPLEIFLLLKNILLGTGILILYYFSFLIVRAHYNRIVNYAFCQEIEKRMKIKARPHNFLKNQLPQFSKKTGFDLLRRGVIILYFSYILALFGEIYRIMSNSMLEINFFWKIVFLTLSLLFLFGAALLLFHSITLFTKSNRNDEIYSEVSNHIEKLNKNNQ